MRKMKRMMMVVGLIYVLSKMVACGEDTNISSVGAVSTGTEVEETITTENNETTSIDTTVSDVTVSVSETETSVVEEEQEEENTETMEEETTSSTSESEEEKSEDKTFFEVKEESRTSASTSTSTSTSKKETKTSTSTSKKEESKSSASTSASTQTSTNNNQQNTQTSVQTNNTPAVGTVCAHTNTEKRSNGYGNWVTYVGGCSKFLQPYKIVCKDCGAVLRTFDEDTGHAHNDHVEEDITTQGDCTHDTVGRRRTVCDCGECTTAWENFVRPAVGHGYWRQTTVETEGDYDIYYEILTCIVCGDVVKTEIDRSLTIEANMRRIAEQNQQEQNDNGGEGGEP